MHSQSVVCFVFRSAMGSELDDGTVACLEAMFLHVTKQLPPYIVNHAGILGNYVRLPIPEDVVDAIVTMHKRKGRKCFADLQTNVSPEHKRQLRKFCSKMEESQMSAAHRKVLLDLPVFETAKLNESQDVRFVSLSEVKRAAPLSKPDVSLEETLVDLSDECSRGLARALGVFPMSTAELLTDVVFRDIIAGKLERSHVQTVITYVLENLHVLNRENTYFVDKLKKVPFVPSKSGLHRPVDLCDPESDVLRDMFFGQDVFPQGEYTEPAYLVLLRQLSLRSEEDLTAGDVCSCVFSTEEQFAALKREQQQSEGETDKPADAESGHVEKNDGDNVQERLVTKSVAVLNYLNRHPHRLEQTVHDRCLRDWLAAIPWVATMQERLPMYPDSLAWKSGSAFARPSELCSIEWFPMVASVVSLCKEPSGPEISRAFNWDRMPPTDTVIAQLCAVVKSYTSQEKAKYLAVITSVYDYLAQQDVSDVQRALHKAGLTEWIWHGDGFVSADKVASSSGFSHGSHTRNGLDRCSSATCLR